MMADFAYDSLLLVSLGGPEGREGCEIPFPGERVAWQARAAQTADVGSS